MGFWQRIKDEHKKRRDPNDSRILTIDNLKAAAFAGPAAVHSAAKDNRYVGGIYSAIDKVIPPKNIFLFFVLFVNVAFEAWYPSWRFAGFNLEFFRYTILGGRWTGLYNILHFNIFFFILVLGLINLRENQKPHVLKVWMTITLITYLMSSIPVLNTALAIRNVREFMLLFFFTMYLSFWNPSKEDFIVTVVLFWVFYNLYMFGVTSTIGGIVHFIIIVLFYIIFCTGEAHQDKRVQIKWWLIMIILFDFFLPEFFIRAFPNFPIASLPFLFFGVLMFFQMYEPSMFSLLLIILFVTFYFFRFAATTESSFFARFNQIDMDEEGFQERIEPFRPSYWTNMIKKWMNQSLYYASGQDYYAGQVDANAKKKLGVYIDKLNNNIVSQTSSRRIILDGVLTAENLMAQDEDIEEIEINLSCAAYKRDKLYKEGKIYPQNKFVIDTYAMENIQCIFEPWELEKGIYEIRFKANFNFNTEAYLKRYFVSKDRVDTLRRNNLITKDTDILKINKIAEILPVAQNTVGPVKIEVNEKIPSVIKLDPEQEIKQIFGLKLVNEWKGKINKIKNIFVFLPDGIEIDNYACQVPMRNMGDVMGIELDFEDNEERDIGIKEGDIKDNEKYQGYNMFMLEDDEIAGIQKDIDREFVQSCGIVIKKENNDKILNPGDVTTRYFWIKAYYDYTIQEEMRLEVNDEAGFRIKILDENDKAVSSSSQSIKCIAMDDDEIKEKITFRLMDDEGKEIEKKELEACFGFDCEASFQMTPSYNKGKILRCLAEKEGGEKTPSKPITIQNTPPKITVSFDKEEVQKGNSLTCEAKVEDIDHDLIQVKFEFSGINLATKTVVACPEICRVEIPTNVFEDTTKIKCIATAYDGDDKTFGEATAKITVPKNATSSS